MTQLALSGHTRPVSTLARQLGVLASGAEDGAVRLWDVAAGSCVRSLPVASLVHVHHASHATASSPASPTAAPANGNGNGSAHAGQLAQHTQQQQQQQQQQQRANLGNHNSELVSACSSLSLSDPAASSSSSGADATPAALCFAASSPDMLYVALGPALLLVDLRSSAHKPWSEVFQAQEDINQIDVHANGTSVATADDSGRVHVLDVRTFKPTRRFRSAHSNIAMSVCFRPTKSWEIWSGGMDNTIIQWDSSRGTVQAQLQCDAMTSADGADLTGAQGVNPPFVYDLAFNASGRMCVAALGDGTIDCIRWKQTGRSQGGRKPVYEMDRQRVSGPHSWSVSAVEFLPDAAAAAAAGSAGSGGGGGSGVGDATGDWFVSASIDGAVALWSVAPPSGSVLPTPELTSTVTAPRKLNAISVVSVSAAEALVAVGGTAKKGAKRALDAFAIDLASLPLELP